MRRERGFTLFEVMAAVLVLGMLYSVLATTAIQGLRSEGESKRRLEASLVADEELLELEGAIAVGSFPELGVEERELEEYQIVVEVEPFDVAPYLGEIFQEKLAEGGGSPLAPESPENGLLRKVTIAVRWLEAEGEHEVRRTTLVYDQAALAAIEPSEQEAPTGPDLSRFENPDGSPNFDAMLEHLRNLGGDAQ